MEKKLKAEPEAVYKINIWFYKLTDLIWDPRRHLKKIPLKDSSATQTGWLSLHGFWASENVKSERNCGKHGLFHNSRMLGLRYAGCSKR